MSDHGDSGGPMADEQPRRSLRPCPTCGATWVDWLRAELASAGAVMDNDDGRDRGEEDGA